jgi:hypothetical protein
MSAKIWKLMGMNKTNKNSSKELEEQRREESKGRSIIFVSIVLLSGGIILCLYSLSMGTNKFMATISISAMIAFTSSIVGAFIGFIFGIPRTPASKDPDNIAANTNLEEISDWITKIIVGVSLVQLNQISGGIVELGNTLSKGFGSPPPSSAFVFSVSILIFYFVGGFFLGYLWSRIYLPKILRTSLEEGFLERIKEKENQLIETQTLLKETKSQQDVQNEIRKEVDSLVLQSDPKNYKDFKAENFNQDRLQKLIDNIIIHFDKKETANLFGQIISSLYKLGYYDLINNLAEHYKNSIEINYVNWTDVALANLTLYNTNRLQEHKERMMQAIENTRKTIADYGVTNAIELYGNLIDLTYALDTKDKKIEDDAKVNIANILNQIKTKPDVTSFEAINYLNRNEGKPKWTDYNKMLRDMFTTDFNEILARSEKYKEANPDVAKFYGVES